MRNLHRLTNRELQRELAYARNARDVFAPGREPDDVTRRLNSLLREQDRRRTTRLVRS